MYDFNIQCTFHNATVSRNRWTADGDGRMVGLVAIFLLAATALSCGGCGNARLPSEVAEVARFDSACPIAGLWIREGDAYANMVLEISKNKDGEISGILLYVPEAADKFRIHDEKMRNIRAVSDSNREYECESLCRDLDTGNPTWAEVFIRLPSDDVMIARDKVAVDRSVGGKQRWRRVKPGTSDMAYVCYGKATIALEFDDLKEAASLFALAAKDRPEDGYFCNALAWELATSKHREVRQPDLAVQLASYACEQAPYDDPNRIDTLAAAYAAQGDFKKAASTQQNAIDEIPVYTKRVVEQEMASANDMERLQVGFGLMGLTMLTGQDPDEAIQSLLIGDVEGFRKRLRLYKAGKPYVR